MKTRRLLLCVFTAMTIVVGCGGTGYEQSSTLTFNMSVLQVDGDFLIHGIVYNDLDGDETFDAGEPGVPDAIVTLVRMSKVMGERTTISDGVFAFGVSEAGAYTVFETDPPGYTSTTPNEVPVEIVDADFPVNFGDYMEPGLPVDVKPGSDINPLNLKSNGVLPVAILGWGVAFDVRLIDPASLLLNGVSPLRWSYEDVAGHSGVDIIDPDINGDDEEVPDGYEDMTLKFSTPEIAEILGDVVKDEIVTLIMTGALSDGSPILGLEMVWIVQIPKKEYFR